MNHSSGTVHSPSKANPLGGEVHGYFDCKSNKDRGRWFPQLFQASGEEGGYFCGEGDYISSRGSMPLTRAQRFPGQSFSRWWKTGVTSPPTTKSRNGVPAGPEDPAEQERSSETKSPGGKCPPELRSSVPRLINIAGGEDKSYFDW